MGIKARHVLFICAFAAYSATLFWAFIYSKADFHTPYGINEDCAIFNVYKHSGVSEEEISEMLEEMSDVLLGSSTTFLYEGVLPGAGLYDPAGLFGGNNLIGGTYFDTSDFELVSVPIALVKTESSVHHILRDNKSYINGRPASIIGLYSADHPLYNSRNEYIFNFFSTNDLQGTYYIWNFKDNVINMLTDIFHHNDYNVAHRVHSVDIGQNLFTRLTQVLISDRFILFMAAGMLFIYYNCFMLYFVLISRLKRIFNIHFMVGATGMKIYVKLACKTLTLQFMGSLLGVLASIMLLEVGGIIVSPLHMLGVGIVNSVLNSFIFALAFLAQYLRKGRAVIV